MRIYIASDHAGYAMKEAIKRHFSDNFEWEDLGTHSSESVDYPDFAHPLAEAVAKSPEARAVLLCGTGNGVAMTANKHAGIRAALCWAPEISALATQHNNANIIVLPARFITFEKAVETLNAFFDAQFEGGRHQRRIDKINIVS